MSVQTTYPSTLHPALTAALRDGDYRPISAIIHGMFLKKSRRGILEKYITTDFAYYLQGLRGNIPCEESKFIKTIDYFLVELYKASVRGRIITHIAYQVHTL